MPGVVIRLLALTLVAYGAQLAGSASAADGHWALKQTGRWTEIVNLDPTCQQVASGAEGSISISRTCSHADGSTSLFAGTLTWNWSTEAGRSLAALVPGQIVTVTATAANSGNLTEISGTFRLEKEDLPPSVSDNAAIDIAQVAAYPGSPAADATGTLTVPQGPYFPGTALMSLRAAAAYVGAVDRIYEWVAGPPPPTSTATRTASSTLTATPTATATRTATPTATPTATAAIDIVVANVEYSQVIQCLDQATGATNCVDNSVPMVKGKNTVVRVYPAMNVLGAVAPGVLYHNAELHIESPIQASIPSLNGPIFLWRRAARTIADDTLNFRLPLEWTEFDEIQLRVELNADRAIPETDYGNNRHVFQVKFYERRPLRIRYVPVRLPGNPSLPDELGMRRAEALARTIFPLRQGDLHYVRGATLAYDYEIRTLDELGFFTLWLDALDSLGRLLGQGEPAYDQLVAWYPDQKIAGLPSGLSDPQWAVPPGPGRVAAAMNISATYNNRYHDSYTLAHEVAHNLGLRHSSNRTKPPTAAQACKAGSPADFWPYNTVEIQEVGYQVLAHGEAALKVANTHSDLMSYCNYYSSQQFRLKSDWNVPSTAFWISPFSYHQLFRADGRPSLGLPVAAQASRLELAREWAVVRGLVSKTGASAIHGVQHMTSSVGADPLPAGTEYSLEWQDASGLSLDSFFFDVDFLNQEIEPVDEEPFLFVLPFQAGTERVVLKRDATVLASHQRSAHAPTLTITAPTLGATWTSMETIRWETADADGDPVTVSLLYRPDDASGWLPIHADFEGSAFTVDSSEFPGGEEARVLVVATDGFNTTIATSEPFTVLRKGPQPIILEPVDGTEVVPGSSLVFTGSGYDPEDGPLDTTTFAWTSDQLGAFGTGPEAVLDWLAEGTHRLTLTACDADGNTGSDTITVYVRRDCAGDCSGDGSVTVDELILGVNIALGAAAMTQCPSLDTDGDGAVTVDELIRAVNHALTGCPAPDPTATPTTILTATATIPAATLTPSPTRTETATLTPAPTSTAAASATPTVTPTVPEPTRSATRTPIPPVPTATPTPTRTAWHYCSASGNPVDIPDADPSGIASVVVVDDSQMIDQLIVTLWIDHGWVGDLVVSLTRLQDLMTVPLIDRPGHPEIEFGCPASEILCEITDAALYFAEDECSFEPPALQGILKPLSPLAVFDGDDLAGTWMLEVSDVAPEYSGRLIQWCIQAGPGPE
jgi:subtilisin-like proprotein convertase family protein